ncbi:ABC transporter substrate-binding protein [Halomarina pelagica]|uniref:ABC transporter substrate-binding protein n=1 Tax=Halomarina pelagica TaxID=2961599 RepID=UPI0020C319D2|nr:ABC transporter substrate-binding protein [Halomarina sp. BND7]
MADNHKRETDVGRSAAASLTRRGFVAAGTAAGAGLLAGCTGGGDGSGNGQPSGGNDSSGDGGGDGGGGGGGGSFSAEVTVTHWPILLYAPPYQMAMENGYFEEEGLEITSVVGSSGGGTTVRNVVTGGLPFGEVATPAAVKAYYAGAPLKIVAGTTNTPGTINWVAPKGSDVTSIADLKGKTVGFTSAGSVTQNTSALAVKYAEGIDPDEVEFKAMGGVSEGLTAVSEGSIAAAANLDPIFSKQQQEDSWQVVFWAKDYISTFQQTCVIAGPDIMEERPDAIRGFLRARARGVEFIRENPKEAAEIFASYNDGYDVSVMRKSFENVEPENYYTTNEFSVEGLQRIEEGMRNIGLIDREVEWTKIATQEFLPEEKRVDLSKAEG